MLTKKTIKEVEDYQKLQRQIKDIEEDLSNIELLMIHNDWSRDEYFNNSCLIKKAAKIALKSKLKILKNKLKEMAE